MAALAHVSSPETLICSICLQDVDQNCARTVVKHQCSHLFHLARRGSNPPAFYNFHQKQPPRDSPLQMLHASTLSTMGTPNGSKAYFQAAGHSGSSMSYIVPSTNLTSQMISDHFGRRRMTKLLANRILLRRLKG